MQDVVLMTNMTISLENTILYNDELDQPNAYHTNKYNMMHYTDQICTSNMTSLTSDHHHIFPSKISTFDNQHRKQTTAETICQHI
jgi:hypothetical protein